MHRTETMRHPHNYTLLVAVMVALTFLALHFKFNSTTAQQGSVALAGNWRVQTQNADGTFRRSYFNLKQEGPLITGSIRVTQFYYLIKESTELSFRKGTCPPAAAWGAQVPYLNDAQMLDHFKLTHRP